LPLADRPRIEAHLAECDACRQSVVDAEQTAWRLGGTLEAAGQPHRRTTRRGPSASSAWIGAIAACLALAFGVQSVRLASADAAITRTGDALAIVAASHFEHVTMTPTHGSLTAKVLFSRDHTWIYCIVDSRARYTLGGSAGGVWRELAQTVANGSVSAAFVAHAGTLDEVTLRSNGVVVADARLR